MDHISHDILERCKYLSTAINAFFEDKLYLQDVEHPEEITDLVKVKLAISLVLDELRDMGIITNLDEEEVLGYSPYVKMVLSLRAKLDKDSLFNEIMTLDENDRQALTYSLESCYCSTDVFLTILQYFLDKFPLDQDWYVLSNTLLTEHFDAETDFLDYIRDIFTKINYTDPNRSYITEENLKDVNEFIANMADRDQRVTTMMHQMLLTHPEVNVGRLKELIEKYDKDKLSPECLPFFVAWFKLKDKPEQEPHFLAKHHATVPHHLQYWQDPLRKGMKMTLEQACMIVFSMVLDKWHVDKRKEEVKKFFPWADERTQEFLTAIASIPYDGEDTVIEYKNANKVKLEELK